MCQEIVHWSGLSDISVFNVIDVKMADDTNEAVNRGAVGIYRLKPIVDPGGLPLVRVALLSNASDTIPPSLFQGGMVVVALPSHSKNVLCLTPLWLGAFLCGVYMFSPC